MSKKRKTKREKIIKDLRKRIQETTPVEEQASHKHKTTYSYVPNSKVTSLKVISSHKDYNYVKKDGMNTLIISLILLGINILFYVLIQRNIINLSFIGL